MIAALIPSSVSSLSGIFSAKVSIRELAALLRGMPSSTLCLKQPRSTSLTSEASIAVNFDTYL